MGELADYGALTAAVIMVIGTVVALVTGETQLLINGLIMLGVSFILKIISIIRGG